MRIAEASDSFIPIIDGVGRVVEGYANHLADKGHECYVLAPMTKTGFRGGLKYDFVDYHSMRIKGQPFKLGMPLLDSHFRMRMNDIKLDIIHAHSPFTAGKMALYYANRRNIPLVGTFHSKYKDDFLQYMKFDALADVAIKFIVDFYERCSEVWAVSEASAETLREYGFKNRIIVMPNGTEPPIVDPVDRQRAAERFNLGNETTFLFVGQQNWKKNIERILLAAERLDKKGLNFKLVMVGQGIHSDEICGKAQYLGLADKMVHTGHIIDSGLLAGLYQCADLLTFPSLYDTFGMVVREAAVYGTPSVVIQGSSAAESIIDGVNGFLCRDDTEELAGIMEYAINNKSRLQEVGRTAQNSIPVDWDDIMDIVLERYQALTDRSVKIGTYWTQPTVNRLEEKTSDAAVQRKDLQCVKNLSSGPSRVS